MMPKNPPASVLFWGLGLVLAVGGCAPQADFRLQQPTAPPAQQDLRLNVQGAFRMEKGDRQVCAITFPLPGSFEGPRAFVLYLDLPALPGDYPLGQPGARTAGGFLVQEIGALAGRSDLASGTVRCRTVAFASRLRRLEIDARTADGAAVVGVATVAEQPHELLAFEREFAGDIATLAGQSQPAAEE